jgi:hypothetical protein
MEGILEKLYVLAKPQKQNVSSKSIFHIGRREKYVCAMLLQCLQGKWDVDRPECRITDLEGSILPYLLIRSAYFSPWSILLLDR